MDAGGVVGQAGGKKGGAPPQPPTNPRSPRGQRGRAVARSAARQGAAAATSITQRITCSKGNGGGDGSRDSTGSRCCSRRRLPRLREGLPALALPAPKQGGEKMRRASALPAPHRTPRSDAHTPRRAALRCATERSGGVQDAGARAGVAALRAPERRCSRSCPCCMHLSCIHPSISTVISA
eukprot:341675-Chlamydomonas_euryale.AAC.2